MGIITAIFTLTRSRCATHLIQSVSHSTQSIVHSIQFTVHADSSWSSKIIRLYKIIWRFSLCFGKKAAIVWRMPQTFDHLWHSTISSPLGCHATLRHLILFGADSTPFTKRSQHFATESIFHRNVNIITKALCEKISTISLPSWFLKIEINFNIRCRVLTSRWNVHTSNMKKNERQYLTSCFIIESSFHKYRFQ